MIARTRGVAVATQVGLPKGIFDILLASTSGSGSNPPAYWSRTTPPGANPWAHMRTGRARGVPTPVGQAVPPRKSARVLVRSDDSGPVHVPGAPSRPMQKAIGALQIRAEDPSGHTHAAGSTPPGGYDLAGLPVRPGRPTGVRETGKRRCALHSRQSSALHAGRWMTLR